MVAIASCVLILMATITIVRTDTDCPPGNDQEFPESSTIYGVVGNDVSLTAYHDFANGGSIRLTNRTLPGQSSNIDCSSISDCTLDQNSGSLRFFNFTPTIVGQYRLSFVRDLSAFCNYDFNITQAIPPSLSAGNLNPTFDADEGPLVLSVTVNPGTPPGEVQWFRNNTNISTGSMYSTDGNVQASDRGQYIANISNLAGPSQVIFTVFVNFSPVITMTATQMGSSYRILCEVIAYPVVSSIGLYDRAPDGSATLILGAVENRNVNLRTSTYDYEASVTYTTSECPKIFECRATAGGRQTSSTIGICQTTPNVTNLQAIVANSSNTSVYLTWSLQPISVSVETYFYEYRRVLTSQWLTFTSVHCTTTRTFCAIQGLSPGVMYEFRVKARNSIDTGPYTEVIAFQTFIAPQSIPQGLKVKRNDSNDDTGKQLVLEWEAVQPLVHSPVTSYLVSYNTGHGTPTITVNTSELYFILKGVNPNLTYYLKVRASNRWGNSEPSAEVVSLLTNIIDPNAGVTVRLDVSTSDTFVVLRWNLTGLDRIRSNTIIINELEITSSGLEAIVTTTTVYTFVITSPMSRNRQCFSGLNTRDRYQFCVIATLENGNNKTNCTITSTSTTHRTLEDATQCQSIQTQVGSNSLIPTWSIVVIVVGSVLLVFFVFGGCGLYYGIKRNQKGGVDFDSPQPSVEDVNGGYPYPTKRAPSPSRSCMAYRHNQQHQHGIDWRVTNPIDQRQDITEV